MARGRSLADLLLDAVDADEERRAPRKGVRADMGRVPVPGPGNDPRSFLMGEPGPTDAQSRNIGGKSGYAFSVEAAPGVPGMRYRSGGNYPDYPRRPRARRPRSYQRI